MIAPSPTTRAIEINPRHDGAFTNRGNVYREKGEIERAIADYTEAINLNPSNAIAHFVRGLAYQFKGDRDQAIANYTNGHRH